VPDRVDSLKENVNIEEHLCSFNTPPYIDTTKEVNFISIGLRKKEPWVPGTAILQQYCCLGKLLD